MKSLSNLNNFLKPFGFKPLYFIFPAFLSLGSAFCEGAMAGLLIPFIKGVMEMNFSFLQGLPVFKNVFPVLPQAFTSSNACLFILMLGLIFTMTAMKLLIGYVASITLLYQLRKISHNMRTVIFNRYLSFGKLYFDQISVGYLNEILLGFTNQVSATLSNYHQMLSLFFMLVIYLSIMFAISWKLTLLVMLIFPTLHYSLRWLIKKIENTSYYFSDARLVIAKKIFNVLSNILLVKVYSRADEEKDHFAAASGLIQKYEFSMDKKHLLVNPVQEIVFLAFLLLLVSAMAYLIIIEHAATIPSLLVYIYFLKRSGNAFSFLNGAKVSFASVGGPITGMRNILDDKEKYFEIEGDRESVGLKKNIEFSDLSFTYPNGIQVLKSINFKMEKGKMTAIVGASGAGKTTLINLILRFYNSPPSSIKVDGIDIREFTLRSYRSHMALVSQDTLLFNDTIRGNITYGQNGRIADEKLIDIAKRAHLYDFVMKLPNGFDTEIGDRGVKLSGGEKQRISIARAILKDPEILILDEATSSLDSTTERLIQESIEELIKGRTSIVIAHRLSTIKNADKIVVIEDGRIVEEGSLQELLSKKGQLSSYWEAQKFY